MTLLSKKINKKELGLVLFFSLAPVMIVILGYYDLSGAGPLSSIQSMSSMIKLGSTLFVLFFITFVFLLNLKSKKLFLSLVITSLLITLILAIHLASVIHRDFYTMFFQLLTIHYTLFLLRADVDLVGFSRSKFIESIFSISKWYFIIITAWIIIMSYSIVIRSEPRWIESTFYNLYNFLLGISMLVIAIILKSKNYLHVKIDKKNIWVNENSISKHFSPIEFTILYSFFIHPQGKRNCASIIKFLQKNSESYADKNFECDECYIKDWAPSQCREFKGLKANYISKIKTKIELAKIGTIISASENRKRIKEEGWELCLFNNVKVTFK
jgi:signal transduction histidine kinase